ncbi:MAG: DUF4857 domain-containing protein [Gammaproteobacteria bacterium]|nr:DUF4857 domain-containing protein [Gammaproteobacteria bacterium]
MTARLARWSLLILIVFLLAVWLPPLKDSLLGYRAGQTRLFYSPVAETFVYQEQLGEGHQFSYRDREGNSYPREAFERLLPFIYYKNMELWGELPLTLGGQEFDKAAIRAERLVLQLKPLELPGHAPRIPLFPLLESDPGRAGLSFPEDVFNPGDALVFINSDANQVDTALSETFSKALAQQDFQFPVREVFGRVSILKPFDAGFFLLDSSGQLFHLQRLNAQPQVKAVRLPEDMQVRFIKVTENRHSEVLGLLLDQAGRLYLMQQDYRLTALELPGYRADDMAIKLIFNPLYRTSVYADEQQIHAQVMDRDYRPLDSYTHRAFAAQTPFLDYVWQALTPFEMQLRDANSRYLSLQWHWHGWHGLLGISLALWLGVVWLARRQRRGQPWDWPSLALLAVSGLYGALALLLLPPDDRPSAD